MLYQIITIFFSKSNSCIIVFIYSLWVLWSSLFLQRWVDLNCTSLYIRKTKKKKMALYGWINSIENGDNK